MGIEQYSESNKEADRSDYPLARRLKVPSVSATAIALVTGALATAAGGHIVDLLGTSSASAASVSTVNRALQLPSFADLVTRVKPAVVSVYVSAEEKDGIELYGEKQQGGNNLPQGFASFRQFGEPWPTIQPHIVHAQGSGFFISSDGYVLTNYHVVDHAKSVKIKSIDGTSYTANIVGTDPKTELAVLKVNGSGFSFVTFADRQPRVGDWVLAMGNPFDLGGTVTAGIVSASGRDIGSGPYNDYLQIDAPVNKGNSGGPSFNLSGEVVGVNTAIYSTSGGSIGIAFDIPADTAKTVAHELETKGKVTRGWIGVTVQALTQDIADNLGLKKVKGALVDEVEDGGPAAKAGLKNGDIIFMLDGSPIADSRDLARKVAAQSPGTPLKVFTRRNGVERTVELTVGTLPNAQAPQSARETQRESGLGMSLAPADQVTGAGSRGVVVLDVDPGGAAAEKGVQQGDVIVGVGGKPVSTPQELSSDINEARKSGRHSVLLRLKSASGPHFVAVPIGQG